MRRLFCALCVLFRWVFGNTKGTKDAQRFCVNHQVILMIYFCVLGGFYASLVSGVAFMAIP